MVKMPKTLPSRRHPRTRNPVNQSLHENRDFKLGNSQTKGSFIRNNQKRREYSAIDHGEKGQQCPLCSLQAGVVRYEKDADGFPQSRRIRGPGLGHLPSHIFQPRPAVDNISV
jgi:hypothetical protein